MLLRLFPVVFYVWSCMVMCGQVWSSVVTRACAWICFNVSTCLCVSNTLYTCLDTVLQIGKEPKKPSLEQSPSGMTPRLGSTSICTARPFFVSSCGDVSFFGPWCRLVQGDTQKGPLISTRVRGLSKGSRPFERQLRRPTPKQTLLDWA